MPANVACITIASSPSSAAAMRCTGTSTRRGNPRTGQLGLNVTGADGRPLHGARVSAELVRPAEKRPPLAVMFDELGEGRFEARVDLPARGNWDLDIVVDAQRPALRAHQADVPAVNAVTLGVLATAPAAPRHCLHCGETLRVAGRFLLRRLCQRPCHHRRGWPRRLLSPARAEPRASPAAARGRLHQLRPRYRPRHCSRSTSWSTASTARPASG